MTSSAIGPTILVTVGITIRRVTLSTLLVVVLGPSLFKLLLKPVHFLGQISHLAVISAALLPGLLCGIKLDFILYGTVFYVGLIFSKLLGTLVINSKNNLSNLFPPHQQQLVFSYHPLNTPDESSPHSGGVSSVSGFLGG